jgi:hypothetical protein
MLLVELEYKIVAPATGRPVTEFTNLPEISPCVVWQIPAKAPKNKSPSVCSRKTKPGTIKRSGRKAVVRCRLT